MVRCYYPLPVPSADVVVAEPAATEQSDEDGDGCDPLALALASGMPAGCDVPLAGSLVCAAGGEDEQQAVEEPLALLHPQPHPQPRHLPVLPLPGTVHSQAGRAPVDKGHEKEQEQAREDDAGNEADEDADGDDDEDDDAAVPRTGVEGGAGTAASDWRQVDSRGVAASMGQGQGPGPAPMGGNGAAALVPVVMPVALPATPAPPTPDPSPEAPPPLPPVVAAPVSLPAPPLAVAPAPAIMVGEDSRLSAAAVSDVALPLLMSWVIGSVPSSPSSSSA